MARPMRRRRRVRLAVRKVLLPASAFVLAVTAIGMAFGKDKEKPAVTVALPAVADVPVGKPALAPTATSTKYAPDAHWLVRDALVRSARALEANHPEEAIAILTAPRLGTSTGVVVERYPALKLDAPAGSLDDATALELGRSRFDASYAIGDLHRRGVRLGIVTVGTSAQGSLEKAFRSRAAHQLFARMTVISFMEPWIRVLQDVAGVRPASELTGFYLASARGGATEGWSDVDVLATLHDLGVKPPAELVADPRFPGWAGFEAWLHAVEITPR